MMNQHTLRAALLKFQTQAELPASQFSAAQRQCLDQLCRSTPALEAIRKGRGLVYRVKDAATFALHLQQLVPATGMALQASLPARAQNIAYTRSSKAGKHEHETCYLLLKSPDPAAIWRQVETGKQLPLGQMSRDYGAAVLQISPQDSWQADGELWLLENQAVFDQLDWLPHTAGVTVAWYRGQVPGLLLSWLAARPRGRRIVHFPDYDGVGLANYTRLSKALNGQIDFWLMPDWQTKLKTFGSNELWQDTYRDFAAIFETLPQTVRPLAEQMQRSGLALEQEAIWL